MTDLTFTPSRRALLAGAAALGATAALPRITAAAASTTVTQFIWTGAQEPVPRRIAEEFMKANPGVMVEMIAGTNGATYPKLAASMQIDPDAPLVNFGFFNMDASARGRAAGLWAPIPPEDVPSVAHILPAYRQPDNLGAFFCMDVVGLAYNTNHFSTAPDSWDMLFDPALKGKIAFWDNFWPGNALPTMAKLHGGSEDDIEVAMAMYEKAARDGQIAALVTSNSQLQQLLISGEVVLTPGFRGVVLPWIAQGAPVGYAVPKEGQAAFPEGFQVVKGGTPEQAALCKQLLEISLSPENVLDYCKTAYVVPLMDNVTLPEDMASDPAIQPEAIANAIQLDYAKIAENGAKWSEEWARRVKANL